MIELIVAVISLISLICFFVMAANIAGIKTTLRQYQPKTSSSYWYNEYSKHYHWGNQTAALSALQDAIWIDLKNPDLDSAERQRLYDTLKIKHEPTIIELKGQFLKYPFASSNDRAIHMQNQLPFTNTWNR